MTTTGWPKYYDDLLAIVEKATPIESLHIDVSSVGQFGGKVAYNIRTESDSFLDSYAIFLNAIPRLLSRCAELEKSNELLMCAFDLRKEQIARLEAVVAEARRAVQFCTWLGEDSLTFGKTEAGRAARSVKIDIQKALAALDSQEEK